MWWSPSLISPRVALIVTRLPAAFLTWDLGGAECRTVLFNRYLQRWRHLLNFVRLWMLARGQVLHQLHLSFVGVRWLLPPVFLVLHLTLRRFFLSWRDMLPFTGASEALGLPTLSECFLHPCRLDRFNLWLLKHGVVLGKCVRELLVFENVRVGRL